MGDYREFSLSVRTFLKGYRWRWSELDKPLSATRMAVVSTAGFVMRHQEPFDRTVRGGDYSYREIPSDARTGDLVDSHRSESFDHTGMRQDPNLAFPLDRVRELVERGRIGSLASIHLSFMGSITAPGRLLRDTLPDAVERLVEDQVDVALLVPV